MRCGARGQALVEAALVLPVLLALGLGVVVLARLGDAVAGVDAATAAAADAAARAESLSAAQPAGQSAFAGALRAYGLSGAAVRVDLGSFERTGTVRADGAARVDLGFAPVPGLPQSLVVHAHAEAPVETWRSR